MRSNIWFCLGTAAELIKVYPLIKKAQDTGQSWWGLSSGQSASLRRQWDDFNLPSDKLASIIETEVDLESSKQALRWFARGWFLSRHQLGARIQKATGVMPAANDVWMIHGDTLSTVLGAKWSKKLETKTVHVEAGLRSKRLLSPFPEEINRRWVSRSVAIHLAPDQTAANNLANSVAAEHPETVINLGANTLLDTVRLILRIPAKSSLLPSGSGYVVANLHRFENLNQSDRFEVLVQTLERASQTHKVLLVQHAPTAAKIAGSRDIQERLKSAGIELLGRQPFSQFIHLLNGADYVISDGGSNQEECYYLGKPCLILRDTTERTEGLDSTCLLTEFKSDRIDRFLKSPKDFQRKPITEDSIFPTETAWSALGV